MKIVTKTINRLKVVHTKEQTYAELEKICELIDKSTDASKGKFVELAEIVKVINEIRLRINASIADSKGHIKYLCDNADLKGNHLKRLSKMFQECNIKLQIKDGKISKVDNALEIFRSRYKRKNSISKQVIEIVRGNLNYSILNTIQNWVVERKNSNSDENNKLAAPFISIEDTVYEIGASNDDENLIKERSLLLELAKCILDRCPVEIDYNPASTFVENDTICFHPSYLRRYGKKWLVYGLSKSKKLGDANGYTYVNLVLNRIQQIRVLSGKKYLDSGIDYSVNPFKDQLTYNSFNIGIDKLKEDKEPIEVKLKVRKRRIFGETEVRPFDRIMCEPLHYTQYVYANDEEYGYICINVTDAEYIAPVLLPWGADVVVIQPESLREKMKKIIGEMYEAYS